MFLSSYNIYKKENFTAAIQGISLTNEMQYPLLPKKNSFTIYMLSLSFNIFIKVVNALPISV